MLGMKTTFFLVIIHALGTTSADVQKHNQVSGYNLIANI